MYKQTVEHRLKHSKALLGYRHSPEARTNMALGQQRRAIREGKNYIAIDPQGREFAAPSLKRLCEAHGLNEDSMRATAQGRSRQHRGWKCRYANPATAAKYPYRERFKPGTSHTRAYQVTSPKGQVYIVHRLGAFCKEHGLLRESMSKIARGLMANHKGWKCSYIALDHLPSSYLTTEIASH